MNVLHSVGQLEIEAEASSTLMHTQFVKWLNVAFITGKKNTGYLYFNRSYLVHWRCISITTETSHSHKLIVNNQWFTTEMQTYTVKSFLFFSFQYNVFFLQLVVSTKAMWPLQCLPNVSWSVCSLFATCCSCVFWLLMYLYLLLTEDDLYMHHQGCRLLPSECRKSFRLADRPVHCLKKV